jgi:hypothetical protein
MSLRALPIVSMPPDIVFQESDGAPSSSTTKTQSKVECITSLGRCLISNRGAETSSFAEDREGLR